MKDITIIEYVKGMLGDRFDMYSKEIMEKILKEFTFRIRYLFIKKSSEDILREVIIDVMLF